MHNIDLDSWKDFPNALETLRNEYGTREVELSTDVYSSVRNSILFRGHANSDWSLKTTLERLTQTSFSVQKYLLHVDSVVNEVESLTGIRWKFPSYEELREKTIYGTSRQVVLPGYEYLVYLRHHGFPSPLLDWTRSPFVAAFFAIEERLDAERAAIYAFIEAPEGGKSYTVGDVGIKVMGPYITTHSRHFSQKATYTIATKWDDYSQMHFFCPHESVSDPITGIQNVFVKITFPRKDRVEILRELDDYNINGYTLYRSEDALIRSLAIREFELDD